MSVTVGNCSVNELGKATGGQKGDQTGREIYICAWYANGWTDCVRAKDPDLAERIASNYEAICANDMFGYGQDDRTSGDTEARKHGYDFSKVDVPCHFDCSSSVLSDVRGCGLNVSVNGYTGNMVSILSKTGRFDVLRDAKYLTEDKHLKRGDILVKQYHHTVVVLSDGEDAMPEPADGIRYIDTDELNLRQYASMDGAVLARLPFQAPVELLAEEGEWARVRVEGYVASAYLSKKKPKLTYHTTDNLNLRQTPGVDGKLIVTMPKGAEVKATGNTDNVDGILWRNVIYKQNAGWCSADYLS